MQFWLLRNSIWLSDPSRAFESEKTVMFAHFWLSLGIKGLCVSYRCSSLPPVISIKKKFHGNYICGLQQHHLFNKFWLYNLHNGDYRVPSTIFLKSYWLNALMSYYVPFTTMLCIDDAKQMHMLHASNLHWKVVKALYITICSSIIYIYNLENTEHSHLSCASALHKKKPTYIYAC